MTADTIKDIEYYLDEYRLNDYTKALYNFVWSDFCDWYIELTKVRIDSFPESAGTIVNRALEIYENILKLLHPVIPFITEEIWHILDESREGESISKIEFPALDENLIDVDTEKMFELFEDLVVASRNERAKYIGINNYEYDIQIKPLNSSAAKSVDLLSYPLKLILNNKGNTEIESTDSEFSGTNGNFFAVRFKFNNGNPQLKQESKSDNSEKELESLKKYINTLKKKLENKNFLEKGAKEVIEKERLKLKEAEEKFEKLSKM